MRKATVSFIMSVRLSVSASVLMEQLDSLWTDFHEISYFSIFRKTVEKIQVLLKSDKNNGYFAWKLVYSFDYYTLITNLMH